MKSQARFFSLLALPMAAILSFAVPAADGLPSTGLGESWPNAPDLSRSADYHVYVFERDGLRYVQVNDLQGTVRGAVLTAGDSILGLPVGVDASRLSTVTEAPSRIAAPAGITVYKDAQVRLSVLPQSDGSIVLDAGKGECTNPRECSVGSP